MPWTTQEPPSVAKNWTDEEKAKCVEAANSALRDGASDEQAVFACIRAAGKSEQHMSLQPFLFIELNEDALTEGRPFDGVAFGTFRDMLGREITLEADDAESYVINTTSAIEATRTESGELVGLPIDAQGHEKGDGAGWIVGVELVNGVIRLLPKWTRIGRELIGEGIRRFFSATIDVSNKVILGGTLTNWPATRDENNRMMLRPIELESPLMEIEIQDIGLGVERENIPPYLFSQEVIMADENVDLQEDVVETEKKPAAPPTPDLMPDSIAELMNKAQRAEQEGPQQLIETVQRIADQEAERRLVQSLESSRRQYQVIELAAKLTGNGLRALPVKVETMTDFLLMLDPNQFQAAKGIFEAISKNGLIEFSEYGHGRHIRKQQLPEVYKGHLKAALDAGNTVADFFQALPDLGEANDYDLSEFQGGK